MKKDLTIIIVGLAIVSALFVVISTNPHFADQPSVNNYQPDYTTEEEPLSALTTEPEPGVPLAKEEYVRGSFYLQQIGDTWGEDAFFDHRLIFVNEDGVEQVLVTSTKRAIPELQRQFNLKVDLVKDVSKEAGLLYFTQYLSESHGYVEKVYKYILSDGVFVEANVSQHYPNLDDINTLSSPSGTKGVYVTLPYKPYESYKQSQTNLLVLDFAADSVQELDIPLKEGEALDDNCDGFGSNILDLTWVNENTIRYAVWKDVPCDHTVEVELIEYRTVSF